MANTNPFATIHQSNADAAYDKVMPEALALPKATLAVINVDIPSAVVVGMGVIEKVAPFYDEIARVPQVPIEKIDRFPDYTLALLAAQTRYAFATNPPAEVPPLVADATRWCDLLETELRAHAARGELSDEPLKHLKGARAYKNVAFDLSGLSHMCKSAWPVIKNTTGIKESDLVEVDNVVLRLTAALARREQSPEQIADVTDKRLRCFTLFYGAHTQLRRVMGFLRYEEEDLDDFVPSLYKGRGNTNIVKKPSVETEPTPTEGDAPEPKAETEPSKVENKLPVGHPNSEPVSA